MNQPIQMEGFIITMIVEPSLRAPGLMEAKVTISYEPTSPLGISLPNSRWETPHPILTEVVDPSDLKRLTELVLGEYSPPPVATGQWRSARDHVILSVIARWAEVNANQ